MRAERTLAFARDRLTVPPHSAPTFRLVDIRCRTCTTRVGNATDTQSATRLAQALGKQFGCRATFAAGAPTFDIQPTSNQQKRLWDLARGFRTHLRGNPPDADYALLAEYLIDPAGVAHSINFVVCDKAGDWVIADLQNNQQADLQRIAPRTVEDCERVTYVRLAEYLR